MPTEKHPCPSCKGTKRHRPMPDGSYCPHKRSSSPRGPRQENPEDRLRRLREEVTALPDGDFTAHARAVAQEVVKRQKKIKEEAKARLRDLAALTGDVVDLDDEDAPTEPAPVEPAAREAEASRTNGATREKEPTGPPGVCGAVFPDNILIKCKQPTRGGRHLGDHHNPDQRKSWPQRRTP